MLKIQFENDPDQKTVEEAFKNAAADALLKLNIPPFSTTTLELARSTKEIAKCLFLQTKAEEKELAKEKPLSRKEKNEKKKDMKTKKTGFKASFKKVGNSSSKAQKKRR